MPLTLVYKKSFCIWSNAATIQRVCFQLNCLLILYTIPINTIHDSILVAADVYLYLYLQYILRVHKNKAVLNLSSTTNIIISTQKGHLIEQHYSIHFTWIALKLVRALPWNVPFSASDWLIAWLFDCLLACLLATHGCPSAFNLVRSSTASTFKHIMSNCPLLTMVSYNKNR